MMNTMNNTISQKEKNVFIWGFHSESCVHAINILKKKGIIDVKGWVGIAPECDHDMVRFYTGDFTTGQYHGSADNIYEDIFDSTIYQFMDMMSRHSFYVEKSFYDMLNIFNIYFDYFSNYLIKKNIQIVLFSNLPHEGADIILYKIAKKMNIKTILFYQTLFPNKFFYVYDIEDFGKFDDISPYNLNPNQKIEKKFEKELFYMGDRIQHRYDVLSLQSGTFRSLSASLFKIGNYSKIKNFMKRYNAHKLSDDGFSINSIDQTFHKKTIPDLYQTWLLLKIIFLKSVSSMMRTCQRHVNHRISRKKYLGVLSDQIDLDKNYIYFPLHLQPELTTALLGGTFVDQLLAIERLSNLIPDDWYIYVKENPKQTELMRGKLFFDRLLSINKVKVVSAEFDTYVLLKNCIFVSTITGTAGWEAISGGKNTLVFGNPWYKHLPGVFSYKSDLNLNDILGYTIDHDELEQKLNLSLSKAECGVIDHDYSTIVKNYDDSDNTNKIVEVLERLLK